MPVSTTAVIALLLATTLAAGQSALAAWPARRRGSAPWWGGLAVGLAYAIGHAGVATPSFPPADVTDRIPILGLCGAVVAVILAGDRGGIWGRIAGYLGLATLAYVVMLGPVLGAGEISRETATWLGVSGLATWLATLNLALLDVPPRRPELWAALAAFALGTGVVLVLANSVVLFQLGGVLALALAASLLGARWLPVGGGIPVVVAVLTALIIEGFVYAYLPGSAALVLAAGPAILWLTRLGPLARLGPAARNSIAVGLIILPAMVAVGLVLASKNSDTPGY